MLQLALSRPGRAVLLALEALMVSRIAARDAAAAEASAEPAPAAKPRARKSSASAETKRMRAAQKERRDAEKQAPAFFFSAEACAATGGYPLRAARRAGLLALGYQPNGEHDGYEFFERDRDSDEFRVIMLGHFGALYEGGTDYRSVARDERDAITEAGKAALAEMVEAAKVKAAEEAAQRAEEQARHAAEWQRQQNIRTIKGAVEMGRMSRKPAPMRTTYRRGKPISAPCRFHPTRDQARAAIRAAWDLRRTLRAA